MAAIRIIDDHLELANIGTNSHAQIDTHIAAADDYVKRDGSLALTSDWDIGDTRKILADEIRARDGAGLKLYDDGGNGIFVEDGGNVGIGTVVPNNDFEVSGLIRIDDTTYGMAIGRNAGHSAGLDNIIIGHKSATTLLDGGSKNVVLGAYAATSLTTGADNMIIGTNAGNSLTDGISNTLIGTNVGGALTGSWNMYFGGNAGKYQVAGTHNVGIGFGALRSASGQSNYRNVGIGALVGQLLTTGNNNTLIGHYAGQDLTSGDGNVLIGHYAGEGWMTTQSNKLVIANSDTISPLIYGEFDNARVGLNTNTPTALLDINSDILRLRTAKTPASAGAAGNTGDLCGDTNYIYRCVSTNSWKRAALNVW